MQKVNTYTIEALPMFEKMVNELLEMNQEQLNLFQEARTGSLDNAVVHHAISNFKEQQEFIALHKNQFKIWEKEVKDQEKLSRVSSLQNKLKEAIKLNDKLLKLLNSLKGKTIESVLSKSDEELGADFLLGMLD